MALGNNLKRLLNLRLLLVSWPWLLVITAFALLRLSKGALLLDLYAQVSRPFWPGSAQREWLQKAQRLEDQQRLALLEAQLSNQQFDLSLRQQQGPWITAAVISRTMQGWWQDLLLGAGEITFAALRSAPKTVIRNYPATSSEPLTLLRVVNDG